MMQSVYLKSAVLCEDCCCACSVLHECITLYPESHCCCQKACPLNKGKSLAGNLIIEKEPGFFLATQKRNGLGRKYLQLRAGKEGERSLNNYYSGGVSWDNGPLAEKNLNVVASCQQPQEQISLEFNKRKKQVAKSLLFNIIFGFPDERIRFFSRPVIYLEIRTTAHFLLLWNRAHVFVGCNQDVKGLIELLLFLCLSLLHVMLASCKSQMCVSGSDVESSYPNMHGWLLKRSLTSININFMLIHVFSISTFLQAFSEDGYWSSQKLSTRKLYSLMILQIDSTIKILPFVFPASFFFPICKCCPHAVGSHNLSAVL